MTSLWLLLLPFAFVAFACFTVGYWCGRTADTEPAAAPAPAPLAEVRALRPVPNRGRGHVSVVREDRPFDWQRDTPSGGIA